MPSDHVVGPDPSYPTFFPATADYMAVTRANTNADVWTAVGLTFPLGPDDTNGVLTANKRTSLLAIPDGLSNTLMIGESAARQEGWFMGQKYADNQTSSSWGIRGTWAQNSNNIVLLGDRRPDEPRLQGGHAGHARAVEGGHD